MPAYCCYICDQNPEEKQKYGDKGLAEGDICPVCHRPVCRYHMSTVRWKWKDGSGRGSALICKECMRMYKHRSWDTTHREWIS